MKNLIALLQRDGSKDMTSGSPLKLILTFTIPLLIGNVFQQFYSMADTIIVGKIIGATALAAVGTTGPINFLVLGFIIGLTSGFAVITAQYFGAKDFHYLRRSIAAIIKLCIITVISITILSVFSARSLLVMINTPSDIIDDAWSYIVIIFAGIATMVLYNMSSGILRALGDSKTPLFFLILSSLLNIGFDFLFILVFHLGVAGAALATVISQGVSGVLCLIYMIKNYPYLAPEKGDWKSNPAFYWRHLRIGLPMAFQFSITAIGVVVLQGALNLFGSVAIAAFTAATKVEQLVTQPAGSFGVTMANYAGQNLGAGRLDRVRDGVRKCTILTLSFAVAGLIILQLFGTELTNLFVNSSEPAYLEILSLSKRYLTLCSLFFPALFLLFVHRNALQGIGRSFMPLMAGVFELVTRVIVAMTLPQVLGFTGICLAGPFAWVSAAALLAVSYFVIMRQMKKQRRIF